MDETQSSSHNELFVVISQQKFDINLWFVVFDMQPLSNLKKEGFELLLDLECLIQKTVNP